MAVETGFTELPVRWQAASAVARLPMHHRDPFDRLLVAQAMTEPLVLYTADRRLGALFAARAPHLMVCAGNERPADKPWTPSTFSPT